jgi:hypothetical protein
MANSPTTTVTVNQDYLIEPLTGPSHPKKYLDRFPEEIYDTSVDSTLVKFLYALLGPSGAGWIKQNYLEVRKVFEENGLQLDQLEKFYGNPLRFGRNLEEIYNDETTGALPRSASNTISAKDSIYRNRVIDFLHAARLGGTPDGMMFAAKSGAGFEVDIIENYKYMFDQHSDEVIGLQRMGTVSNDNATDNVGEFIIIPNRENSQTVVQTITFDNQNSTQGYFTLTFNDQTTLNGNQGYNVGTVTQSGKTITGSEATFTSAMIGGTITITGQDNKITGVDPVNNLLTVQNAATIASGTAFTITFGGLTNTATSFDVLTALSNLLNIGIGNITVTGSMYSGFKITFTNALSGLATNLIKINSYLKDAVGNVVNGTVSMDYIEQPGAEISNISTKERHLIDSALDKIKPVNTLATYKANQSVYQNQVVNNTFANSEYYEVLRYVTGSDKIEWPKTDSVYWIEKGIEKEAPRIYGDMQQHYTNFHTPAGVYGYSSSTLLDSNYSTNIGTALSNNLAKYISMHIGVFNNDFLKTTFNRDVVNKSAGVFTVKDASRALAHFAENPIITTQSDYSGTPFVNGIYPVGDKYQPILKDVLNYKDKDDFWASTERFAGESDYLEIDFGQPKAINFMSLQVCKSPVDIEISYDEISGSTRNFVTVTPEALFPFHKSLYYSPDQKGNPWESLAYNFTDYATDLIFTRYIRIKFTRRSDKFLPSAKTPWPILVKNLRLGRSV